MPTAAELAACAADVKSVRCAELAAWLASGRACSILDVRTEGEHLSHRIPGATLVPLHELVERIDEVLALPGPLVVHCEHGIRSLDASVYLVWQGRADVFNVVEGIAAWPGPLEHGRS
jgi:rhodanese-related sulfurtransferase